MAKNKQQKKKDREKRVAKKKIQAAANKRTQDKEKQETKSSVPGLGKVQNSSVPKATQIPTAKKSTFTQRRTGG